MSTKKNTKQVAPEGKAKREHRWTDEIDASIGDGLDNTPKTIMAAIRAAVYAVVPGKQTNKNIHTMMEDGMKAARRAISRTKK
jgi:hypothetical protein